MRPLALLSTVLLLSACATRHVTTMTPELANSVAAAEAYVARHGYTVAGHPSYLPVERVEVTDMIYSETELVNLRKGTLESRAFGVSAIDGGWYVLFRPVGKKRGGQPVVVIHGEPVQVIHANFNFANANWQLLPPNKSLERSRDR